MEETTLMFFDKNFNPVNYIDALYKDHKFTKSDLNELLQVSNNLIIHYNFLIQNLNAEINANLTHLMKLTNENKKLDYYMKSLQIATDALDAEIQIPEFNQLLVINDLINFKQVKAKIQDVLSVFQVIASLDRGKGELDVNQFESNVLNHYNKVLVLESVSEKLDKINQLIELNECFKNLQNFSSIYKRNLTKFIQTRDSLT